MALVADAKTLSEKVAALALARLDDDGMADDAMFADTSSAYYMNPRCGWTVAASWLLLLVLLLCCCC